MVPAPTSNIAPVQSNQNEGCAPEEDIAEDEEEPNEDETLVLDKEENRDFSDELVGLKLKVLYENGWVIGEVEYYNKALKEYKVSFNDGTNDFIPEDEIGGGEVEVIIE